MVHPQQHRSQDGAPPAALVGVLRGVDLALQSVHEVGEVLPTVLTVTLGHRHHADHVTLEVWKIDRSILYCMRYINFSQIQYI